MKEFDVSFTQTTSKLELWPKLILPFNLDNAGNFFAFKTIKTAYYTARVVFN
jgi:hypothetical protein